MGRQICAAASAADAGRIHTTPIDTRVPERRPRHCVPGTPSACATSRIQSARAAERAAAGSRGPGTPLRENPRRVADVRPAKSTASSTSCIERSWSTSAMPIMLGAMSDITRSTLDGPTSAEQLLEHGVVVEIALQELDARDGRHVEDVHGDDPALAIEQPGRVLAPAAGRGAEVDDRHAGLQQPVADVWISSSLKAARERQPSSSGPLHIRVRLVLGEPGAETLGALGHGGVASGSGARSEECGAGRGG